MRSAFVSRIVGLKGRAIDVIEGVLESEMNMDNLTPEAKLNAAFKVLEYGEKKKSSGGQSVVVNVGNKETDMAMDIMKARHAKLQQIADDAEVIAPEEPNDSDG